MDVLTSKRWRRRSLIALCAGCLILNASVIAGASAATSSETSESASQVLKAAIASATHEGSVRVTVHFFSGKTTGELVQDSAQKSGVQTVAIGKERISIVLVGGIAYFAANSEGLISYFGFDKVTASALSGKWISISPTDTGFQSVISGLTLSSALKEVTPTGSILSGKRSTVNRQSTTSLAGTGAVGGRTTLFVASKGKPLPVEAVASQGSGKSESGEIVTFSRWGEKVHTPEPSQSIPISTLSSGTSGTG
jgi:hypothetical protein